MRKGIYVCTVFMTVFILSFNVYAVTSPSDKHVFTNTDREVNFDVERKSDGIALYIQSQMFGTYDEILIERSESDVTNFAVCKTIEVGKTKMNGDYYATSDKYPLPSHKDCYYRIKVVGKDGSMKTFPPVLLTALNK